jgi:AcrR family transcriptional regulator
MGGMDQPEPAAPERPLPEVVVKAWGLTERAPRGPRPGLTLDRIVRAAVAVARADGLGAVSMSRVAADLGVSTMGLYRYVSDKTQLVTLMVDHAYGTPPPLPANAGWREGLTHWATSMREVLTRDVWVVAVPIASAPLTPNSVAWMEQALAAMRGTTLTPAERMSVLLLISGFVRNEVTLLSGLLAAASADPQTAELMVDYGRALARLTDPERFPALREIIETGVLDDDDDPEEGLGQEFAFGLGRILDGIEALIRSRA